jgi:hypothetical protein
MANQFEIQVRNTIIKITVGGGGDASSDTKGGSSPNLPPSDSGGGDATTGSGPGCCCAPIVIGPIVVEGSSAQAGTGQADGGSSPNLPPSDSGGGGPKPNHRDAGLRGKGGSSPNLPPSDSGGGAPTSNSGCCPTVVIGPIVFTGCCSGQGAPSDSDAAASVREVTVDPPSLLGLSSRSAVEKIPFTMQPQQQTEWCWSAVAVSVNDFLNPATPPTWTQPTLATSLLTEHSAGTLNCSVADQAENACNQPEALDAALTITKNLWKKGFLENERLAFECLQKWSEAQLPVCARIAWREGGYHFITLGGTNTTTAGQQQVWVLDPLPGTPPKLWDYESLAEHYGLSQLGFWLDTYLLTK